MNYSVSLDDESSQYEWVSLEKILELPLADSQKRRIQDVIEYLNTGTRKMIYITRCVLAVKNMGEEYELLLYRSWRNWLPHAQRI